MQCMQKGLRCTEWGMGCHRPGGHPQYVDAGQGAGGRSLCSGGRPEVVGLEVIPPPYCLSPHFLASIKEEIRAVRKPLCLSLSGSDFSHKGVS